MSVRYLGPAVQTWPCPGQPCCQPRTCSQPYPPAGRTSPAADDPPPGSHSDSTIHKCIHLRWPYYKIPECQIRCVK